ncbi:prepilin-type N-terminal cleavage/methylation domain-containing protein [Clostridium aestuarii]|uniref:Prepilin-type N-terminal cleavage/methylation domain-containing protein n=1 Tax=Clostridium aestuarii TaxID=338193 RepID=A0ABT4CXM0_9CLOT|nr:prepilin-type N-terminal cleavage/methylation domain-containing protein [Clostridium aestuarii]MCY6483741.1 prepilin-type N-terminal cleavage/methylation domain-containing protein [Clostridium aestuarii]
MKKGFTLIELIITLFISNIIILMGTNMIFNGALEYKKAIKQDREKNYCTEALRFIETQIEDKDNKDISVNHGELVIKKNTSDKENIIKKIKLYKKADKLQITYYKKDNFKLNTNTIINNIEQFDVYRDKNVIYVGIESESGKKYERCFGIKVGKKVS